MGDVLFNLVNGGINVIALAMESFSGFYFLEGEQFLVFTDYICIFNHRPQIQWLTLFMLLDL